MKTNHMLNKCMVTPDVVRDWRDNNGFPAKAPNATVKENQALTLRGSNPAAVSANENPGAPASATGAYETGEVIKPQGYIKDRETATALCHAILDCDPDDACDIMTVAFERLRAGAPYGMPIAPLLGVMDEANFWAEMATRAELKAYCLACFTRLSASDQSAFLAYVQRSDAA